MVEKAVGGCYGCQAEILSPSFKFCISASVKKEMCIRDRAYRLPLDKGTEAQKGMTREGALLKELIEEYGKF